MIEIQNLLTFDLFPYFLILFLRNWISLPFSKRCPNCLFQGVDRYDDQ